MENIGTYVIYVIMACAVVGAIASIINAESELAKEFTAGLHSIGPIFIPVGLAMLNKADHKYMALGIMAGLLSIPISIVLIAMGMQAMGLGVRPDIATAGAATQALHFTLPTLLRNLSPLILFCVALAAALRYFPNLMVSLFLKLGQLMYAAATLVLVASIVEYFTGAFTALFGGWGFAPIIADKDDQFRALEIAGYVGIMLCGAFPMVYLIKRFLSRPIETVASRFGLSPVGAAGVLAASANILAMFRLVGDMPPKDKVLVIAFAVCAAFTFGDHLAYSANFQPTLIGPLIIGKLASGLLGMLLAYWLAVPKAEELGRQEQQAGLLPVSAPLH